MQPTWNKIRLDAAKFAEEWRTASYEKGEAQSFYNEFFAIFGIRRRSVARFEEHVKKLDNKNGFIDVFWPGTFIAEHKSAGGNLDAASTQAGEYFDALKEAERPRFRLVCDFQNFRLADLDSDVEFSFPLTDLASNVEHFAFMLGKQSPSRRDKTPVNLEASETIARLFTALARSQYPESDLERFLTRVVFCLFADDTGIFQPRGIFEDAISSLTKKDGSDLGPWLSHLFQVLNTREASRQAKLDPELALFPYINGQLFAETLPIPSLDEEMRDRLIDACSYDWSAISPAIFGSLFQSVLTKEDRREIGGHFTSEQNIKKVLSDLFLTDLTAELESILATQFRQPEALERYRRTLRGLTFLDPACGCGNFLAVAYSELRKLELRALLRLKELGKLPTDLSLVNVDQFYGIEQREYSARIAETALWMTDHIANNALSLALQVEFYRVPLVTSPAITIADALSEDWAALMPRGKVSFIIGNPPYEGSKLQSDAEREQVSRIATLGGEGGTLDYVCGWVLKAAEFLASGTRVGFVTVNSIVQGEQAGQLWPVLFERYDCEIAFAHQAFAWNSDAPRAAQVQVVIIGLVSQANAPSIKSLNEYRDARSTPIRRECGSISPYLISADNLDNPRVVVRETSKRLNGFPKLRTGTKPIDGGYYILTELERVALLAAEPAALEFIRPFVGGREFLEGGTRYVIVLKGIDPSRLRGMPALKALVAKVRDYRKGLIPAKDERRRLKKPNSLFRTPTNFHIHAVPLAPFLIIPEVTSERRDYVPIAWMEPPVVPSNLVKYLENATVAQFGLLTSAMHMAWLRTIGGKLEGRYRYSIQLVYNTFPSIPERLSELHAPAARVLSARAGFPNCTLEELYDPDTMPEELRRAHKELDSAVDMIYLGRSEGDQQSRMENLLNRYTALL